MHSDKDMRHSHFGVLPISSLHCRIAANGGVQNPGDFLPVELEFIDEAIVELAFQANQRVFHDEHQLLGVSKEPIYFFVEYFFVKP